MDKGLVLLCAGGTGGHLFPAEAVAHELVSRGYRVHLAADHRVERFAENFPAEKIHQIRSATLGSKNPVAIAKTVLALVSGYAQSRKLLKQLNPVAVAGFGGYPTVPPLLAASMAGIPTLIHEANAVLGRANRMLSRRVSKVAMGFGEANPVGDKAIIVTGNPVRPAILAASQKPFPDRAATDRFNLLVFGGSQGAAFFGDVVPKAIAILPQQTRELLHVVQQARPEDKEQVMAAYRKLGVQAIVDSFFGDMASLLSDAHFVVSRAGASTVSELAVVGRPAILVPYPHALDHDQAANAELMARAGGVSIEPQPGLTPERLAAAISEMVADPKKLAIAAENAKKTGKPDATGELAGMIEQLALQRST